MSSVAQIHEIVEKRVREALIPALLNNGIRLHKRRWKTCDCTWCFHKRNNQHVVRDCVHITFDRNKRIQYRNLKANELRKQLRFLELML